MLSRRIGSMKEPLDVDFQLIAVELDTSPNRLKYLSEDIITDAVAIDAFVRLLEDIEKINGVEITSFDDNTVMYEYRDEAIIIHEILGMKYLIFDSLITCRVEAWLDNYK